MKSTDLIQYLTDNGYTVYPDPNFIPADFPDNKLPCLFVMDTGGFAPHDYVPTERPTWQIVIKGRSYKVDPVNIQEAETIANDLKTLFHRKSNYTIGKTEVFSSLAMQQPIYLGLDDKNRPMYSINFVFYVKET